MTYKFATARLDSNHSQLGVILFLFQDYDVLIDQTSLRNLETIHIHAEMSRGYDAILYTALEVNRRREML